MSKVLDKYKNSSLPLEVLELPDDVYTILKSNDINTLGDLYRKFYYRNYYKIVDSGKLVLPEKNWTQREIKIFKAHEFEGRISVFENSIYRDYPDYIIHKKNSEMPENAIHNILHQLLFDLPISILLDFPELKNSSIQNSKLMTIGELEDYSIIFRNLIGSTNQTIDNLLTILEEKVKHQIKMGRLHPDLFIIEDTLKELMDLVPSNIQEKFKKLITYKYMLFQFSLKDNLFAIINSFDQRNLSIFFNQTIKGKSIATIETEYGLKRAWISSITKKTSRSLQLKVRTRRPLYLIQMSLIIAVNIGSDLTFEKWKNKLLKLELISKERIFEEYEMFEILIAFIKELHPKFYPPEMSSELVNLLNNPNNLPDWYNSQSQMNNP